MTYSQTAETSHLHQGQAIGPDVQTFQGREHSKFSSKQRNTSPHVGEQSKKGVYHAIGTIYIAAMCAAHTQGRGRAACIAMQAAEEQCTSGAAALVMGVHSSQIVKQSRQPVRQSSESLYNTRTCAVHARGYKSGLHSPAGERCTSPIMGSRSSHNSISLLCSGTDLTAPPLIMI